MTNFRRIRRTHQSILVQLPLSFRALLGQYVTRMRMSTFDLPRSRHAKTFSSASVSLYFWHCPFLRSGRTILLSIFLLLGRKNDEHIAPFHLGKTLNNTHLAEVFDQSSY